MGLISEGLKFSLGRFQRNYLPTFGSARALQSRYSFQGQIKGLDPLIFEMIRKGRSKTNIRKTLSFG